MLPFIKLPGFRKQSSIRIPKHDHLSLARVMQGSSDRIRWAWEGRRRSSGHVTSHVIRLKTKAREIFIRLLLPCVPVGSKTVHKMSKAKEAEGE